MRKRGDRQSGAMRAEDYPGSSAINVYTSESDFGDESAAFTGTQRKRPVGFLDRHPSGTVGTIFVHPSFRGRGIAGRMYDAAGQPPHSNELTEMGAAWSKKVGGEQHTERGEERVKAEPLAEEAHTKHVLPVAAKEIRDTGVMYSRGSMFRGT
jgi:GNAT superfamily N-acetyltransferase